MLLGLGTPGLTLIPDGLGVFEGDRPGVRIRTDKRFVAPTDAPYAGFEPEHAALLDASSRRLTRDGPIVAGGAAARLDAPSAPLASPRDL